MATFRSHDLQTKRCLTLCCGSFRNLAYPYGSGRVAAYTPNAHSLPLSSQAQSYYGRDPWLHILGTQKITQYKIVRQQNRFSLLWYPIHVYGEVFSRQVFHFTWMRKPKIFCFQLYYTSIYRKVNPISSIDSSIFNKFYCIKNMKRCYVNA